MTTKLRCRIAQRDMLPALVDRLLLETSAGKELTAADRQATIAERQGAMDTIQQLETQRSEKLPPLEQALTPLSNRVKFAERLLRKAERELAAASAALSQTKNAIEFQIDRQRGILRYAPEIDEAIAELNREVFRVQANFRTFSRSEVRWSRGGTRHWVESNAEPINLRVNALRAAMRELEALRDTEAD